MDQDDLLNSLVNMRNEALKQPAMCSMDAQKELLDAISIAEKLVNLMEEGLRKESLINFINNVNKPYVMTRERGSNDVYYFCNNILGGWIAGLNEQI